MLWALAIVAALLAAHYFDAPARAARSRSTASRGSAPGARCSSSLLYVAATVFFLPGSILTLGAGVVFGLARGVGHRVDQRHPRRHRRVPRGALLARDWVAAKIEGNPKFKAIDEAVAREGWKIVALLRLSPVVPFNLLNYAFGLTRVSLRDYVIASWIGMMPGTLMYVYLGSVAGDLAGAGGARAARRPNGRSTRSGSPRRSASPSS